MTCITRWFATFVFLYIVICVMHIYVCIYIVTSTDILSIILTPTIVIITKHNYDTKLNFFQLPYACKYIHTVVIKSI